MHCKACDVLLNEFDIRRKCKVTGEHLDLCSDCYLSSQEAIYDPFDIPNCSIPLVDTEED